MLHTSYNHILYFYPRLARSFIRSPWHPAATSSSHIPSSHPPRDMAAMAPRPPRRQQRGTKYRTWARTARGQGVSAELLRYKWLRSSGR